MKISKMNSVKQTNKNKGHSTSDIIDSLLLGRDWSLGDVQDVFLYHTEAIFLPSGPFDEPNFCLQNPSTVGLLQVWSSHILRP